MSVSLPPPGAAASLAPAGASDALQRIVHAVMVACDVVFGATCVVFAVIASWLLAIGEAQVATVVALWSIPLLNAIWSVATRRRDRIKAELLRGAVCLPITTFIYLAEPGTLVRLWVPALTTAVGISLSVGMASRRSELGFLVTVAYGGALLIAAFAHHSSWDPGNIRDAIGLIVIGLVISVVASRLGRSLEESRRQRDGARAQQDRAEAALAQLTVAIESLHHEMERRMQVELELRQAQKLESIGRLAAGVAHEINTPVQFVSDSIQFVRDAVSDLFGLVDKLELVRHAVVEGGATDAAAHDAAEALAAADLPYLSDNVPRALDRASEGLDRVATIVRSMKEFAHPDSKAMAPADLNRAVESTLTVASNEYKQIATLEAELGELPPVRCYVGELNQAVLNIVVNATHAIGDVVRDGDDRGVIRVRTYRDGDDAIIAIADTGPGIPDAIRDHIFDPFFTTKEVGRGTGQGLAIARSVVVDKHGGQLSFDTELGKGTTFYIRLPIQGRPEPASAAVA